MCAVLCIDPRARKYAAPHTYIDMRTFVYACACTFFALLRGVILSLFGGLREEEDKKNDYKLFSSLFSSSPPNILMFVQTMLIAVTKANEKQRTWPFKIYIHEHTYITICFKWVTLEKKTFISMCTKRLFFLIYKMNSFLSTIISSVQ